MLIEPSLQPQGLQTNQVIILSSTQKLKERYQKRKLKGFEISDKRKYNLLKVFKSVNKIVDFTLTPSQMHTMSFADTSLHAAPSPNPLLLFSHI